MNVEARKVRMQELRLAALEAKNAYLNEVWAPAWDAWYFGLVVGPNGLAELGIDDPSAGLNEQQLVIYNRLKGNMP